MTVGLVYSFLASLCAVSDRRRGLGGRPLGKMCRVVGLVIVYMKIVVVIDALVSGSPIGVLAKLNTSTTVLVLIFGSAVVKLMTKIRLSTGSVLHPKS